MFCSLAKKLFDMPALIAPSMLSADFGNIERDTNMVNNSVADWFHIDIMDGVFVPNISFGFPVLKSIQKHAQKPLDVHLMIVNPDQYLTSFADAGAAVISVHYEACTHLHRSIQAIKALNVKAGVAINPHTNISLLADVIKNIDLVCVMSVNPGFGGQKFIEHTYSKVEALKNLIIQNNASTLIEIDGGVDLNNARKLVDCGADVLVAGNTVFGNLNPLEAIRQLKLITA